MVVYHTKNKRTSNISLLHSLPLIKNVEIAHLFGACESPRTELIFVLTPKMTWKMIPRGIVSRTAAMTKGHALMSLKW